MTEGSSKNDASYMSKFVDHAMEFLSSSSLLRLPFILKGIFLASTALLLCCNICESVA